MRNSANGFTMVELIIVITIMGIITAIAGPSFNEFIYSSRLSYSTQLVETSLGRAFSEARSRPKSLTIRGWVDSRNIQVTESEGLISGPCSLGDDGCQKLDAGITLEADFELEFKPPYGDIISEESETLITVLGKNKKQAIRVYHASGLVETMAPEKR